jgi:ectoine hydroxylase-related dioxygenase (phytanoyl-CoA dioxygenase family)
MYDLNKDGFKIFKGVFEPNEILQMRKKIQKLFQRLNNDNLVIAKKSKDFDYKSTIPDVVQEELEAFNYVVFDERVLRCVRELIGSDIAYFQDSTIQNGIGLAGYHKDNVSRDDSNHSDWKSNYDLIRMGIYFQNIKDYSGGINIKSGSHKHANLHSGKAVNIPLETGDIVFWKLTTTHSGNAKRLKMFPRISLPGRVQRILPEYFFLPEEMERMALFACFGKPGIHLETYINYFKSRNDAYDKIKNSHYSNKARSIAAAGSVRLIEI